MADEDHHDPATSEAPPPFCGTWPRLYALVIAALAFWIAVFYVFTKVFTP